MSEEEPPILDPSGRSVSIRGTRRPLRRVLATASAIVTVMAILAGVATNIETIKRFLKGSDSELQLVDATFADRNTLDIRLRNTGSRIASVKRIEIDVKKIWVFRQLGGAFAYTASSHTYTVRLPVRPFPYTIQSVLSQDIAAGATDRFQVSFGAEAYDQQTWTAFARRHLKWERPKITEEQAEQLVRSGAPSFIWHDGGKADPPPDCCQLPTIFILEPLEVC